MRRLNVLVVGSGGREHALVLAARRSAWCGSLYCAPGNAGTAAWATNVAIDPTDAAGLASFARSHSMDLVLVGPEAALSAGVADACRELGIAVLGPGREAAQLEGSKIFSKQFMDRHGLPTARWQWFDDVDAALAALSTWSEPPVIKADGLAAGKGVVVPDTMDQAMAAIREMLGERKFGSAGARIILEARLPGEEVSWMFLTDGQGALSFPPAQDHKRIYDGDKGPNTGGMGAYAPTTLVDAALRAAIEDRIVKPFVAGLAKDKLDYRGIVYAGLMVEQGIPRLLEFNVRFGDPECQVLLAGLREDFLALAWRCATAQIGRQTSLAWREGYVCAVVVAAEGYPDNPVKGDSIAVTRHLQPGELLHAGTSLNKAGQLVSTGGRVLTCLGQGPTITAAQQQAYVVAAAVEMRGAQLRRDIGARESARQAH